MAEGVGTSREASLVAASAVATARASTGAVRARREQLGAVAGGSSSSEEPSCARPRCAVPLPGDGGRAEAPPVGAVANGGAVAEGEEGEGADGGRRAASQFGRLWRSFASIASTASTHSRVAGEAPTSTAR